MERVFEWCRRKKVYMSKLILYIFEKIRQHSLSNEMRYEENERNNTVETSLQHKELKTTKEETFSMKKNVEQPISSKVVDISENEGFDISKKRLDLSQSNIIKYYRFQKCIANSAGSIVYQLQCPLSYKFLAIKVQHVRVEDRKAVTRELNTLKKVKNHPFLIQLTEFEYLANSQILLFVMECADCDLSTFIKKTRPLSLSRVQLYSQHLLDGISFLHEEMNVMHCDLKPHNLLICGEHLKIGDFGLCRPISDTMDSYLVTRWYRCPELLNDEKIFDERIDIWSFGCIVWEMMFSKPLFPGSSGKDVMAKILFFFEKTGKFENCTCDKICRILTNSIVIDYKERWSASKLLWILEMQPIKMKDEDSASIDVNIINFEKVEKSLEKICASDNILENAL